MESFFVEAASAHLRYHDLPGDAPPLVFLHGLGSASSSYYPRVLRYAGLSRRRTLLVDFLGFGYSDRPPGYDYSMASHADGVARLLRSLALTGVHLIGHSMGGSIAIAIASEHPGLVSRLVAAEANLDPGPGIVSGLITRWREADYVDQGHTHLIGQMRTAGFLDYAGTLQAADPAALHRSAVSLISPREPSFRERLLRLPMHRTFVFGEENRDDPDITALAASGISVAVISGAGHDMANDNPEGFARAVADAVSLER